jgi:hypothetical protein
MQLSITAYHSPCHSRSTRRLAYLLPQRLDWVRASLLSARVVQDYEELEHITLCTQQQEQCYYLVMSW